MKKTGIKSAMNTTITATTMKTILAVDGGRSASVSLAN